MDMCSMEDGCQPLASPLHIYMHLNNWHIQKLKKKKIVEVHFHKYSLDIHLRSTVRSLNPRYNFTSLSLSLWGQIDRQLVQTKWPPISQRKRTQTESKCQAPSPTSTYMLGHAWQNVRCTQSSCVWNTALPPPQ